MKNMVRTLAMVWLAALLAACASMEANKVPGADLASMKTFYVQKLPADQRGVDMLISDRLNAMGYKSRFGAADLNPGDIDGLVTYQDRWRWDITMYMLQLEVQVRDPKTQAVVASGKSFRPSLQRKTPEGMVEEVMTAIFKQ